jgi:uncharacterized protein (DUF697 family)
MPQDPKPGWSSKLVRSSIRKGLGRAYHQVRVDPQKYLQHLRRAHKLPIREWEDMFLIEPEVLLPLAERTIRASTKLAALEGAGFGLGGLLTIFPDMGVLSAITVRLLQKLSLLYGFEYATEDETVELWLAAASAAGLDLGREFVEKRAIEQVIPRIMDRIAVKVGAEVAEKWSGRLIPILSAGAGGTLNYYFVRSWGRRAQKHFAERHRSVREQGLSRGPILLPPPSLRSYSK